MRHEPRFSALTLLNAAALQARRPACPGHKLKETRCTDCTLGRSYTFVDLAAALGVDPSTPRQWVERGGLTDRMADEYSTALGLGPENVWPDYTTRCIEADEASGAIAV